MMRLRAASMLVVLLAGCNLQQGHSAAVGTTQAATTGEAQILLRWSRWVGSAVPDPAYPELPQRGYCGSDRESDLWFLDSPKVPGRDERWTCTMPAGRSLVVVPINMASTDHAMCERGFDTFVPIGSEAAASVDGAPIPLSISGPIPVPVPQSPRATPGTSCMSAHWGMTRPLTAGPHTVILQAAVAGEKKGTITVGVTAE